MHSWKQEFLNLLTEDLHLRRASNPRYSLRAYAKYLGLSAATMSEVMRNEGNWQLSQSRAVKIIEKMRIAEAKKNRFCIMAGHPPLTVRTELPETEFSLLTDWRYPAVLYSHALKPELRAPKLIAERLNLKLEEVEKIIESLKGRQLLLPTQGKDVLECRFENWQAETPPTEVIRDHHRGNLRTALDSIESVEPPRRDITGMTFCGTLKNMPAIRAEIRAFQEKIMALMADESGNEEVLQLNVTLYPLTKEHHDKEKMT